MSDKYTDITTHVGRLVQGDLYTPSTTDMSGAPLVVKTGANAGQPRKEFFFAVAFAKNTTEWAQLQQIIYAVLQQSWPQHMQTGVPINLSTKITDGDYNVPFGTSPAPCEKEGFPGHWVVSFKSGRAPNTYDRDNNILPEGAIKKGSYIQVVGSICSNENAQKPGIYINHNMVKLIGYGEEIKGAGGDPSAFGAAPALPVGASAIPLAGSTMPAAAPAPMPGAMPMPMPGAMPAAVPALPTPGIPAPAAPVIPIPAAAPVIPIPAAAAAPPLAPAPAAALPAPAPDFLEPKVMVQGQIVAVKDLVTNGWTQAQIAGLQKA